LLRLQRDVDSTAHTGATAHPGSDNFSACADPRASAYSSANTSPATANTSPVLHWSRRGVRCPLLFGRVVWRERIQLLGLRWELVWWLFADASSTDARREPNSCTSGSDDSGSDAAGSRPKCVLHWSGRGVQCSLLFGRMVRCEREQLCCLRGRLVQLSISACVQLHDEASERPQRLSGVDGRPCSVMAASEGAEQLGNEQK